MVVYFSRFVFTSNVSHACVTTLDAIVSFRKKIRLFFVSLDALLRSHLTGCVRILRVGRVLLARSSQLYAGSAAYVETQAALCKVHASVRIYGSTAKSKGRRRRELLERGCRRARDFHVLVHCRRQRQEFANYEILSDARSDTIHYCDEISTSVALRGNVDASKWKQRIARRSKT